MKQLFTFSVLMMLLGMSFASSANNKDTEIQHLLNFVANSNCLFIRNNDEHPAKEAKSHIESKYDYVKDKVNTAEDFIKYAATQSSFSGKPYTARCSGKTLPSSQWLLDELKDFRNTQTKPK